MLAITTPDGTLVTQSFFERAGRAGTIFIYCKSGGNLQTDVITL